MWELISKITLVKGVQIVVILFANLIAPYWFFIHFYPEIVAGDNMLKQMVYCLAVGIPLTIIGYVTETIDHLYKYKDDKIPDMVSYNFRLVTYSCIVLIIAFYLMVVFKYYGLIESKKQVNSIITSIYLAFFLSACLGRYGRSRVKRLREIEAEKQASQNNKTEI